MKHIVAYYHTHDRELCNKMECASSAAIHLMWLARKHAIAFTKAWYVDQQIELAGVFSDVKRHFEEYPSMPYFVCHCGNYRLECLFLILRAGRGTHRVLDIVQLRQCLRSVSQVSQIVADNPKFKVASKQSRFGDNMNPLTASVWQHHPLPANIAQYIWPCWLYD